jgi:hypothetical protein
MADLTKVSRDKAKSHGFAALGIPIGSTLVFKKDPAVTVKTLDDKNKVEYLGKPYSISTLAKQLVGSPVSGYLYFKFEGKVLKNLVKGGAAPSISESAEAPVEETVESPDDSAESEATGDPDPESDIDPLAGEIETDAAAPSPNEA